MDQKIREYLDTVATYFRDPNSSEMSYRAGFQRLLEDIFPKAEKYLVQHDQRTIDGNKPDFIVIRDGVPLLYIEVKKVGEDLDKYVEKSDQASRYFGYTNLVISDYLNFKFYRNGEPYEESIEIGHPNKGLREIEGHLSEASHLVKTFRDFIGSSKEPIKSGKHLAKIMGGKGQRIRDNMRQFFVSDSDKNTEIMKVYETIKKLLVHDLDLEAFSDMYAQTLVYGLFVARYHDETLDDFTRQEARDLIPKSNPLLLHFFDHIVGPDFDKRLEYIVNELCEVFSHADVKELMKQYFKRDLWGDLHGGPDPVIHFYEDFLREYDPDLRKSMGAFYTPLPVVRFIVETIDHILEKKFNLVGGLANTSKLENGLHRVQILDPAVGTGTFVSGAIRQIYARLLKQEQKGRWPAYVHHDLLPRLHGFELMMAPYTIAHLKLSMAFKETGFWKFHRRLGIYLTNSLEEAELQQDLFASFGLAESITQESKEACRVKRATPVMVVLGNPPYSGESSNAFYSGNDVYKVEPSGGKLQERNSKWLNDDYVKFMRLAESMVEKTDEGVVSMITAHGYIDNPTFRGMRYHLMQTFDEIYVLDLHGNANKKETTPDGGKDENVFDIKQGVAIFIGVKHKDSPKDQLAKVYSVDCFGTRKVKFEFLKENSFSDLKWVEVKPMAPNYEWVMRDRELEEEYKKGFSVDELFTVSGVGIITARDKFVVSDDESLLIENARRFRDSEASSAEDLCREVGISNKKGWDAMNARKELRLVADLSAFLRRLKYRIFDEKKIFYHSALVWRVVEKIMQHLERDNIALVSCRQVVGDSWNHVFLTSGIVDDSYLSNRSRERGYVFPLYVYSNEGIRLNNLNECIVSLIEKATGGVSAEEIFDYIYALLYSPNYREKYSEFLKIDFPRIPYPKDNASFNKLASLGKELRLLHLLESEKIDPFAVSYPVNGDDVVGKLVYKDGKVFINDEQYFGNVAESAWEFYVGGYQPAQKWLKDRKGRKLKNEDIVHYQKIVSVLGETVKLMGEIDSILIGMLKDV